MTTSIGQTIWDQITTSTKMACGARNAVATHNGIHFNVLKGNKTKIQVSLDADDTYSVRLIKIGRDFTINLVESADMVYVDNLNEVIYRMCNK